MTLNLGMIAAKLTDARVVGDGSTVVSDVACDSRTAEKGSLFAALKGERQNGIDFLDDAVKRGAVAILTDTIDEGVYIPQIVVPNVRLAMAVASHLLSEPILEDLTLIGVTGTNGKTTTCSLIDSILQADGRSVGVIGTLGYRVLGHDRDWHMSTHTTPESPDLYRVLRSMHSEGVRTVVMEVSSHALVLYRVWGLSFGVAVYTNLTQDHLDFHGTMENYFNAKAGLFDGLDQTSTRVINISDQYGLRLTQRPGPQLVTFGWDSTAAVFPRDLSMDGTIRSTFQTPNGTADVEMGLVGRFNVSNALAATAVATALQTPFTAIEEGLRKARPASGRFESVADADADIVVIVDYAHTPDALTNVLSTAKEMTKEKLWVVVGCGGDRDRTKRPLMGAAAAEWADVSVITSDNPRTEDPEQIIDDVMVGVDQLLEVVRITDRRAAILQAVTSAEPGDVVVIAGKGHEPYIEIGTTQYPFDDRDEARAALSQRLKAVA